MCCTATFDVQLAKCGLLGRNGSAASTTAKAIMGLVDWEGDMQMEGKEPQGKAYEIAHSGPGAMPESRDVFPNLTVHQNLLLGQRQRQDGSKAGRLTTCTYMFPRPRRTRNIRGRVMSGASSRC